MSISTAYKAQEPNCPNPNPSPAKAKASSAELESPGQRCSVDSFCISSLPVKVFTRATQKTKKRQTKNQQRKINSQRLAAYLALMYPSPATRAATSGFTILIS